MKRVFTFIVVVFVFIPVVVNAGTVDVLKEDLLSSGMQSFPDVSTEHHNYLAVEWMSDEGTIQGYQDGTFGPDLSVNRAELMKMVVLMGVDNVDESYANCFPDVKDEWFARYVCYANEMGWIDGYPDGTFKPGNNVNRVEALKIILNATIPADQWPDPTEVDMDVEMPVDFDMEAWYGGYVRFAIVKELVDEWHMTENQDGSLNYYPSGDFTRKEVAEMLFRIMIYRLEREDYVFNMAGSICYYVDNQEAMSEAELETGVIQLFEDNGYTEAEMDALTLKYEMDNVVQDSIEEKVSEMCGT